jgi:hypothetical protein
VQDADVWLPKRSLTSLAGVKNKRQYRKRLLEDTSEAKPIPTLDMFHLSRYERHLIEKFVVGEEGVRVEVR